MYVTPRQRRRYFWTSIILILGLPITAFATVMAIRYFTGASGSDTPQNVVISNLTSNSVSISWSTDSKATGAITTNAGKGDSTPFVDIRGTDRRKTHHVDIVDLDPSKDYNFVILSNNQRYSDEEGKTFKFRTSPVTSQTPVPSPVYGLIEGDNKEDVLVYVTLNGRSSVYPASSAATGSGKWIIDLSALRDPSSNELIKVDDNTEITVTAKGTDTLGGTLSGTYGELVDDEGQMFTPLQLSDVPLDSLFAAIPRSAQIALVAQSSNPPPKDNPPANEEPEEEEPEEEEQLPGGEIAWGVIPGTNTSSGGSSAVTGADSVQITNITDSGFTVVWLSGTASEGSVNYGTTVSDLGENALDERDSAVSKGAYTAHSVKLLRLSPETKYFFEIKDGNSIINDGGKAFTATTFKTLETPPEFKTVAGKFTGPSDPSDAVVVVGVSDEDDSGSSGSSSLSSTIPDDGGSWVITLGDLRDSSGAEYFTFSDDDTVEANVLSISRGETESAKVKDVIDAGINLTASAGAKRRIVKVSALASYGITIGNLASVNLGAGGGGGSSELNVTGSTTPETALSTPLIVTLVIGMITFLVGVFTYIKSQARYRVKESKSHMVSSVI
ncbi:fibronectin type III domain-containing protein [bacterium]|nr:fibronectin type III domain-containing protein [bacterium]